MPAPFYLRHPAVIGDQVVVVADDDLWLTALSGGRAHRITDGRAAASHPIPSPDGTTVAFTGLDAHHPEAFVAPLEGGPMDRLSYLGATVTVTRAWDREGRPVVSTNAGLPFSRDAQLVALGPQPGHREPLGYGSAHEIAFGKRATLLGRHTTNQGRWKRYRGGTAGQLWVDADGDGAFQRLLPDLAADIASPMLIGDRAYFIADHTGVGNIWSCALDGSDLQQHTHHDTFYARFASTDGHHIVYTCGGDLYRLDPAREDPEPVDVEVHAPRTARAATYVPAASWLQSYEVHPRGTHIAARVRGQAIVLPLHDGPATHIGQRSGASHRLITWLADGETVVLLSDSSGEERLEVFTADGTMTVLDREIGVVVDLVAAPTNSSVALTNQDGELVVIDLADPSSPGITEVATSIYGIDGPSWSADGRWLAYSERTSNWYTARVAIWDSQDPESEPIAVSPGDSANRSPSFDPAGRHLYWIASTRFFPTVDGVYFDRSFAHPDVIMACVLREADHPPLHREPRSPGGRPPRSSRPNGPEDADATEEVPSDPAKTPDTTSDTTSGTGTSTPVEVDLDGLQERTVTLPFPSGRYRAVVGLHGKVQALALPLRPPRLPHHGPREQPPTGQLEVLDLDTGKHEVIVSRVSSVAVSADRKTTVYASKKRLRAVRAGVKPPEGPAAEGPTRISGWIDLGRVSVRVDPPAEWRQLFDEAWRLQRDLFWHHQMPGVDWDSVRDRYRALIDRIATRGELTDLLWEMFGELGTGHAYVRGGDHPKAPKMPLGFLGADLVWGPDGWRVDRILRAESTDPLRRRPLLEPGVRIREGDIITAIDGVALGADVSPWEQLVNRSDSEVRVAVTRADDTAREVTVRTLSSDQPLRYADWVIGNRTLVAEASNGRVGYVHIPDMGPLGFAEFHRQYLAEAHADALVVDVRFNGGGNVSSLLLEKLASRRIGYQMRRSGALEPYPHHAPAGPLVAVTNEKCGSDGDIFTHAWKRLDLGPVVGTRTWGGVIGIQPRLTAADGMVTTQPAFAFWFDDVGWGVENYGTDPTHPVEITPQDAVAGHDPQLATAVDLALSALDTEPPRDRPTRPA
ncbi:S41 family peptidase [Euzebya tangerina]|uniref:S41 family peptidase n=1 Tax=Euzebya tangerina TaxID=591198 RepID=UPI000E31BA94|nr:S41 family peptidase [Euzebya tangerina]